MAEEASAVPLWFISLFVIVLWLLVLQYVLFLGVIAVGGGSAGVVSVSASFLTSVIH